MTILKVSAGESGQRLNKFLMKYLNQAPSSFIYKMLRKKNITINHTKARGDEIIQEGDEIKLFLSDETIDKFRSHKEKKVIPPTSGKIFEPEILYADNDIMAVHKPAGILSQKSRAHDVSINEIIVDYCYFNRLVSKDCNADFTPSICNRLDRNTSGIILAGISLHGSQMLCNILREHDCEKYYVTLVKGDFRGRQILDAYIRKDRSNNISEVVPKNDYLALNENEKDAYSHISSVFYCISGNGRYTLIKVKLITGKSHQIRAGLKHIGYPVAGDGKYGNSDANSYFMKKYGLKHHLLHCGKISFDNITITDPLPDIFVKICRGEDIDMNFSL